MLRELRGTPTRKHAPNYRSRSGPLLTQIKMQRDEAVVGGTPLVYACFVAVMIWKLPKK